MRVKEWLQVRRFELVLLALGVLIFVTGCSSPDPTGFGEFDYPIMNARGHVGAGSEEAVANARALKQLGEPVSIDFESVKLEDTLNDIHNAKHLNLFVDWNALAMDARELDASITLKMSNVATVKAITVVFQQMCSEGLYLNPIGYTIVDGVVIISTAKGFDEWPMVRLFGGWQLDYQAMRKLRQRGDFGFDARKLSYVLDYFRHTTGLRIRVDQGALQAAGAGDDPPITLELSDVSYATALQLVLKQLPFSDVQIGYSIVNGEIWISRLPSR